MMLRDKWEKRAGQYQDRIRGVLYRGLPDSINEIIDHWHSAVVRECVGKLLSDGARIVDLGSGYGRMSDVIQQSKPDSTMVGVDFSYKYCQSYADRHGYAVCADIRNLPFIFNQWDGALAITSLMYIDHHQCKTTICEIINTLKPGGVALFIDPGSEIIKIIRLFSNETRKNVTGGDGFSQLSYIDLFDIENCVVVDKGCNMIFTIFLPFLVLISNMPMVISFFSKIIVKSDMLIKGYFKYSLHRWILVRRV